ncbi:hypothetical protein PPTG_23020 [Phytophthora nicotianae INRA-310]|uniref:Uncharacterized protein n=1 Tax=Phytophthora nicotianae (strain INRA-310) TaxID=761204 RepID=W2Q5Q9_PHYN3|nr:hypothetical protein PPTG_23020 [Phytophthora nicotianae INRA-310]ETN08472.1 hypothetical protein PPTG_23020 [Phytophthora nicotianae INRA-310]
MSPSLDATKEQGEVTDLVDSGRVKIQTPEPTELRINRHSNAKKNDHYFVIQAVFCVAKRSQGTVLAFNFSVKLTSSG